MEERNKAKNGERREKGERKGKRTEIRSTGQGDTKRRNPPRRPCAVVALPLVHSTAGGGDDEEVAGKRWRGREEAEDRIKTEGGERGRGQKGHPPPPSPSPNAHFIRSSGSSL